MHMGDGARAKSIVVVIVVVDAANSFDQARFFQENAEQVFHVVYETCMHHIEKMKRKHCHPFKQA